MLKLAFCGEWNKRVDMWPIMDSFIVWNILNVYWTQLDLDTKPW